MTDELDVAVVGAGPFGLSVAACLPRRKVRVFGEPMKTWSTTMPRDMVLRSAWAETSLAAPSDEGSIIDWARREGVSTLGPIPLETFLAYAAWFRQRFVREADPAEVTAVVRRDLGFEVTTSAGDVVVATTLVVAVGVTPFSRVPPELASVTDDRVRVAIEIGEFDELRGRRVLVLGGGQAALEAAGRAARAGAIVELVSRSPIHWFADREPDRPRSALRRRLYRLAYPAVGYGPPPLNRLVLHPDQFAHLPASLKRRLSARLLRPGGSPWLRELVEEKVRLTESRTIRSVASRSEALDVELDDGSVRAVDALLLATGYRCDLDRLAFLDGRLTSSIRTEVDGWPILDRYFRSTARDVYFVGYAAEWRFGPISRFVLGATFTANRVAAALGAG